MNVLIDACSLINLTNAGALSSVLSLNGYRLAVGPLVLGECHGDAASEIAAAYSANLLDLMDSDHVPVDHYLELLDLHDLGEGETECIAVANITAGSIICCDDRRARRIAKQHLGAARVIGSLRLLKWCVDEEILNCDEAHAFFLAMRAAGGFLPVMEHDFFCSLD